MVNGNLSVEPPPAYCRYSNFREILGGVGRGLALLLGKLAGMAKRRAKAVTVCQNCQIGTNSIEG